MLALHLLLIVGTFRTVDSTACTYTSWSSTFDKTGQSLCNESNYYMKGLQRNDGDDLLKNLIQVRCCGAPAPWSDKESVVIYEDWSVLDSKNTWAKCPSGYFLQGLFRSTSGVFKSKGYLSNIDYARCAKPQGHPYVYGECHTEDINECFNKRGECGCKEGFYIHAVYRGNGDHLKDLDLLRCCSMAAGPRDIENLEDMKTSIMDKMLIDMAKLADMLGYGWCFGRRGLRVGDDFERSGDILQASTKTFKSLNKCDKNMKCDKRLKISFDHWMLSEKQIRYGQSVFDELAPDTIDSGTTYNKGNATATESFTLTRTVEETVTHTMSSSWARSHKAGISLKFSIPVYGGGSFAYEFNHNKSSSMSNMTVTMNSRTFTKQTSKTLLPNSAAKYSVILSKSRTTIPYTAIVIAKFSTQFSGFLRFGGGLDSSKTNYHQQFQGKKDEPIFNYTFGSFNVPFYEALKKESESQSQPWLWNELFQNYPEARGVIKRLTNETQYELTLSGTLQRVSGTKIDVIWEPVKMTRREVQSGNKNGVALSKHVLAVLGPNDRPVKVEYPVV